MVSGIYWSRGGRASNEDSLALEEVCTNSGDVCLAVISDGIASLDHGETVSGYVVECIVKWFYGYGVSMKHASAWRIKRSLTGMIIDCHMKLREIAEKEEIKWGATCSMLCIWGNRYVSMNIGDSGILLLGGGVFHKRRTVRLHDKDRNEKGELTKAVCSLRLDLPSFRFGRLRSGQSIILASDGFLGKMDENSLGECLSIEGDVSRDRIEHRLARIGNENEARGESDNQSAIYIVMSKGK